MRSPIVNRNQAHYLPEAVVDGQPVLLTPVKSSNVSAAGYDAARRLLVCQFHSGAVYVYRCVSPQKYAEFQAAPSKGKFLRQHIADNHAYPCARLDV